MIANVVAIINANQIIVKVLVCLLASIIMMKELIKINANAHSILNVLLNIVLITFVHQMFVQPMP